jgi:hypothetical protein
VEQQNAQKEGLHAAAALWIKMGRGWAMSGLGVSAEKSADVWLECAALGDDGLGFVLFARHRFSEVPGVKLTLIHLAVDIKLASLLLYIWKYSSTLQALRGEMTVALWNHLVLQNRHCGYAVSTAGSGAHSSMAYVQLQLPDRCEFDSMGRPGWLVGAANRIVVVRAAGLGAKTSRSRRLLLIRLLLVG